MIEDDDADFNDEDFDFGDDPLPGRAIVATLFAAVVIIGIVTISFFWMGSEPVVVNLNQASAILSERP